METEARKQFLKRIECKGPIGYISTDVDATLNRAMEGQSMIHSTTRLRNRLPKLLFVANTGRGIDDVTSRLAEDGISDRIFDITISNNGSSRKQKDENGNEVIVHQYMDQTLVENIIDEFLKLGGSPKDMRWISGRNTYVDGNGETISYYGVESSVIPVNMAKKINEKLVENVTKLNLAGDGDIIPQIASKFGESSQISEYASSYRSKKGQKRPCADITAKGYDKGTAIKEDLDRYGITNFIVIGNDMNDVPMFEEAIRDNRKYSYSK